MHKITQKEMKNLTFPDYDVEKMEYFPEQRILRIFVQGAWLDTGINQGHRIGRGILFFNDWEHLTITSDASDTFWDFQEIEGPIEPLKDLCDVTFTDKNALLCGFTHTTWMEWEFINVKMHAEFAEHVEDDD